MGLKAAKTQEVKNLIKLFRDNGADNQEQKEWIDLYSCIENILNNNENKDTLFEAIGLWIKEHTENVVSLSNEYNADIMINKANEVANYKHGGGKSTELSSRLRKAVISLIETLCKKRDINRLGRFVESNDNRDRIISLLLRSDPPLLLKLVKQYRNIAEKVVTEFTQGNSSFLKVIDCQVLQDIKGDAWYCLKKEYLERPILNSRLTDFFEQCVFSHPILMKCRRLYLVLQHKGFHLCKKESEEIIPVHIDIWHMIFKQVCYQEDPINGELLFKLVTHKHNPLKCSTKKHKEAFEDKMKMVLENHSKSSEWMLLENHSKSSECKRRRIGY